METATPIEHGTVARLWRYPVKSMLGESHTYFNVNARGVEGDRLFAIRTAEGKFGSGKTTRRFRHIDGLFGFQATYHDNTLDVTFPTGQVVQNHDPHMDTLLSNALGQPVTLAMEGTVSHLDAGPVHLLTTAALAWLHTKLPASVVDERRFRPNILVDAPGATQVEHDWCGRMLRIGPTVTLHVREPTVRCGMVGFTQTELPNDPAVLRCITHDAGLQFGVYATVVVPGRVQVGDPVSMIA